MVVDVLRASTTICHALAAGAVRVKPVGEVEEARTARERDPAVVLGGERGGRPIDGFDLGNTPTDYTADSVGGRTVVFTTTNGTRALLHAREAGRVVVGCFANLTAVVDHVRNRDEPIHVLCAGTDGEVTLEDCLFAGAVVNGLLESEEPVELRNDSARLVLGAYRAVIADGRSAVHSAIAESLGGRNLTALGLEADIATAARVDTMSIVPVFDHATGAITP